MCQFTLTTPQISTRLQMIVGNFPSALSCFLSAVLVVSRSVTKQSINEFVRDHLTYTSCRFLVYARPYLDHGVLFTFGRVAGARIGDKPGYRSIDHDDEEESGWSRLGWSENWFILSVREHWIRVKLDLGTRTKECWKQRWHKRHASIGTPVQVVLSPTSPGPSPRDIIGEFLIRISSRPVGGIYENYTKYTDGRCPFHCARDGSALLLHSRGLELEENKAAAAAAAALVRYFIDV